MITLANKEDAKNFYVGHRLGPKESLLKKHLPWFWPQHVVTAVYKDEGIVVIKRQTWSWLRWRWV